MEERKTIRKLFFVWDFEKEERWLNSMARQGWLLESVGFCRYTFVRCEEGEYTIRLELHGKDDDYIRFMEEMGAEYVDRLFGWLYFRRKTEYGRFDIFSDIDSRIQHLDKIGKMLLTVGVVNGILGVMNSFNPAVNNGWSNLLCACLLFYGLGRIHGKKENLIAERTLRE